MSLEVKVAGIMSCSRYLNELGCGLCASTMLDHVVPDCRLRQCLGVADDQEEELRPCDSHVETSFVDQEAKCALKRQSIVASYAVEDDDVLFSALKGVDCIDFDGFWKSTVLSPT